MATRIVQSEANGRNYLRVSGEMTVEDALLVERLADELYETTGNDVAVDLADLDFLDSESAPILRRIDSRCGIVIEGLDIFLQSAIDSAERTSKILL